MLPPNYFYWFRIDIKHMPEPWLDQALMDSAYRSAPSSMEWWIGSTGNWRIPYIAHLTSPTGLNEYLPWVLLGLCTAPREDSVTSVFEAVYGSDLVLPKQFLKMSKTQCLVFPLFYLVIILHQLQISQRQSRPLSHPVQWFLFARKDTFLL